MSSRWFNARSVLLLWATGDAACFCVTRAADHIDIVLCVGGEVIELTTFANDRTAIDFGIARMPVNETDAANPKMPSAFTQRPQDERSPESSA